MNIKFIRAEEKDAKLMIRLHNASFYEDFIKYGECPGYNRSVKSMLSSIRECYAYIIYTDGTAVGDVIVRNRKDGIFYIGSLCVIPEFQHKGIGQKALHYIFDTFNYADKFELKTPADKDRNILFYKKAGFKIKGDFMDGNVKVYDFVYNNK